MNRIDRLSAILNMLQSAANIRVQQIAERFGISKRTVYRDLKALEEAGVPLAGDGPEGYSLVDGYKLPPLMFSRSEATAFLAAQQLVGRYTDRSIYSNYNSGIDKIKAVMQKVDRLNMNNLSEIVASRNFNCPFRNEADYLATIIDQIASHKRICISYFAYSTQQESQREIDPIGVFFSQANWYLIAYCHLKQDYRTFQIKRIKSIRLTQTEIDRKHPPFDSFLKNQGAQKELRKVVIRVEKKYLTLIGDSRFYQGLVEEKDFADYVEMHFMTFSLTRFARWYLSYMDILEIIEPTDLQSAVKEIIENSQLAKNLHQ